MHESTIEIRNARRILCLGPSSIQALRVIEGLTGVKTVVQESESIAGTSYAWDVKTSYYTATVPIWLDEITDLEEWQAEFMKAEAKQVIDAIGAWIFCFIDDGSPCSIQKFEQALKAIQAIIEHHNDGSNDAVLLAVAMASNEKATTMSDERRDQLEDITIQTSFELIDYAGTGINDYGEKQGLDRIKEALEANEWASNDTGDDLDLGDELDMSSYEGAEFDAEIFELKTALVNDNTRVLEDTSGGEHAGEVDDLELMLGKLLAVKEQSSDLPLAQRKRIAAEAVREVMQPRK